MYMEFMVCIMYSYGLAATIVYLFETCRGCYQNKIKKKVCPVFNGQEIREDFLTIEDGTR